MICASQSSNWLIRKVHRAHPLRSTLRQRGRKACLGVTNTILVVAALDLYNDCLVADALHLDADDVGLAAGEQLSDADKQLGQLVAQGNPRRRGSAIIFCSGHIMAHGLSPAWSVLLRRQASSALKRKYHDPVKLGQVKRLGIKANASWASASFSASARGLAEMRITGGGL
jgi:hypothetical protein